MNPPDFVVLASLCFVSECCLTLLIDKPDKYTELTLYLQPLNSSSKSNSASLGYVSVNFMSYTKNEHCWGWPNQGFPLQQKHRLQHCSLLAALKYVKQQSTVTNPLKNAAFSPTTGCRMLVVLYIKYWHVPTAVSRALFKLVISKKIGHHCCLSRAFRFLCHDHSRWSVSVRHPCTVTQIRHWSSCHFRNAHCMGHNHMFLPRKYTNVKTALHIAL